MTVIVSLTKGDQIYSALRERLMNNEYEFGQVLSTYELAEEFGVSRRPVMDAAMRLASDGFITIIRQVGCQVIEPSEQQIREHFTVAGILEGAAARIAAQEATPADIAKIKEAYLLGQAPSETGDAAKFATANREFHAAILEASNNQRLAELARQAWDLSDFYLRNERASANLLVSHSEHGEIADAIAMRELGLARELMERHLSRFWTEVELPTHNHS